MTTRYKNEIAGLDLAANEAFTLHNAELKDDIKYPSNWFENATEKDIEALGFVAYEPPPPPPPSSDPLDYSLRAVQFHAMLGILGKADAVESAINNIKDLPTRHTVLAKLKHNQSFERDDPMFAILAPAVGLTDAEIDAAWMQAKDIR